MRYKEFFLFLLSTSVFFVYGFDTNIDIIHKNVRHVFSEDSKDLLYDEGDTVHITFTAPSTTGNRTSMTLRLLTGEKSEELKQSDDLMEYIHILTKDDDDRYLVCDIRTKDNQEKQLKVHFKRNVTENEQNAQMSGNLFKIVLISLGAFIATSIFLMIVVALYNKFRRKSGSNRPGYPIYDDIIPMKKTSENSKENNDTKLDLQNDDNSVPNVYVDAPHVPSSSNHIGKS